MSNGARFITARPIEDKTDPYLKEDQISDDDTSAPDRLRRIIDIVREIPMESRPHNIAGWAEIFP